MNRGKRVVMSEREARYWAGVATRQLHALLVPAGLFCVGGKPEVRGSGTTKFTATTSGRGEASATFIGTYTPEVSEAQVFEDLQVWLAGQRPAGEG